MKKNGFTLIELLVVVAIIGILAAVGVVAYNGYTTAAKIAATKAQYKTIVQHQIGEITKCQLGMIGGIGNPDYYPRPCPLRNSGRYGSAGEWITSFGNQCGNPGGVYLEWRNPYDNSDHVCEAEGGRYGPKLINDNYVGNFLYEAISATEISLSTCWKTPCSSPENRKETIIDISDY